MLKTGILSCLLAFPIAAMLGFLYRFPVPFVGCLSGVEAIVPSMKAVWFYSVFGLLPAIFFGGTIAGVFVPEAHTRSSVIPSPYEMVASFVAAFIPLGVLSILDKIIGPW